MHQIRFPLGLSPDPLAVFKGPTSKGREGYVCSFVFFVCLSVVCVCVCVSALYYSKSSERISVIFGRMWRNPKYINKVIKYRWRSDDPSHILPQSFIPIMHFQIAIVYQYSPDGGTNAKGMKNRCGRRFVLCSVAAVRAYCTQQTGVAY